MKKNKLNFIINHAKKYGFLFKSCDIYNGLKAIYDYGPYGLEMKNNIKKFWWNYMVKYRNNIIGIDSSILVSKKVLKYSGHIKNFNENFIIIKKNKKIYDIKNFIKKILNKIKIKIKNYNNYKILKIFKKKIKNNKKYKKFDFKIKKINLMFKTKINNFKNNKFLYLRPETAQGTYLNFKNIINSLNIKLPFGISQIGKSFRNEIITKEFIFRIKEFEQMEMQFFIYPGQEKKWYKYWLKNRLIWHYFLKLGKKNYKLKKHIKLSHYNTSGIDINFKFLNKFKELEGIHFRKDYDLKNHIKYSKKNITFFDIKKKKRIIPYVIETSLGLDRIFYAIFCKSLKNKNNRIFLKLPFFISPIKIAILPLIKKNKDIIKISKKIFNNLKFKFNIIYDENKSIGKRYKLQDSIGTPYCITIDKISTINNTITIRNRNNMKQIRYNIDNIYKFFKKKFNINKFYKKNINEI
ncbi:MAG: glycine--tRNA ligase [Candidatus Shikimatogenerans sp. JK-2022]|nr:glycine--tRNA ligase [Candidatus Shikimatogenerans bostrichidophilus]